MPTPTIRRHHVLCENQANNIYDLDFETDRFSACCVCSERNMFPVCKMHWTCKEHTAFKSMSRGNWILHDWWLCFLNPRKNGLVFVLTTCPRIFRQTDYSICSSLLYTCICIYIYILICICIHTHHVQPFGLCKYATICPERSDNKNRCTHE